MDEISRRSMLAVTAAGGALTLARSAGAQGDELISQPQRAGRGGTDRGPRNLERDRRIPTS
jgi:oxalate decarboxylase